MALFRHFFSKIQKSDEYFPNHPNVFDCPVEKDLKTIKKLIGKVEQIIISDTHLCISKNFQKTKELFSNCEQDFIFFENNFENCLENVTRKMMEEMF